LRKHKASISAEYDLVNINIEDNFEYEANALKARFPGRAYVAEKRLMYTNYDQ
jgi:hypothetical protein